jgi:hypothetical protein
VGLPVQQVDDPLLAPRTSQKQRRSVHPLHLKEPKAMTVPIQRSSRSGVGKLGGGAAGMPEVGAGWSRRDLRVPSGSSPRSRLRPPLRSCRRSPAALHFNESVTKLKKDD